MQPKTGVGGHLIVTGAPSVELAAHGADELAQATLVGGVDVFIPGFDFKGARLPLGSHLGQAVNDLGSLLRGENPGFGENAGVCLAPLQIKSAACLFPKK